MAKQSTTYTPPAATVLTELWYAETEDTGLKQIFGIQSIPVISAAKEDITYRVLESDEEFAVKGVRAFETIAVELISQIEQHKALKALADADKQLWWYVKLPDAYSGTGEPLVVKWRGSIDLTFAEIPLDDMIKDTLTIGKSSVPEEIEGLPAI